MSHGAKREYLMAIHARYQRAARPERTQILTEFCRVTGYHRKSAVRLLDGRPPGVGRSRRRRRPPKYGPEVISGSCSRSGRRRGIPGPCASRPGCPCGCRGPCGGRLRLVATVDDPHAVHDILAHLGLPPEVPRPDPPQPPPAEAGGLLVGVLS